MLWFKQIVRLGLCFEDQHKALLILRLNCWFPRKPVYFFLQKDSTCTKSTKSTKRKQAISISLKVFMCVKNCCLCCFSWAYFCFISLFLLVFFACKCFCACLDDLNYPYYLYKVVSMLKQQGRKQSFQELILMSSP